jgi:predicted nucleotidyltransferase
VEVADVIPAERMAQRAAMWAAAEDGVRAAIVYGSVAQGTADDESDLDLILVTEPGRREGLWERRTEFAEFVLESPVRSSQEPFWQRAFRYQSWGERGELDLTLDEGYASPWRALKRGFRALCDKADVADRLAADLAEYRPPEFDAPQFDRGTWGWLRYLRGKLRHGETWFVRYGVMDTLNNRVVPLLGSASHSVLTELGESVVSRLHQAAPKSGEPEELKRSLLATAELYDWALSQWALRTGRDNPRNQIAAEVLDKLRQP